MLLLGFAWKGIERAAGKTDNEHACQPQKCVRYSHPDLPPYIRGMKQSSRGQNPQRMGSDANHKQTPFLTIPLGTVHALVRTCVAY